MKVRTLMIRCLATVLLMGFSSAAFALQESQAPVVDVEPAPTQSQQRPSDAPVKRTVKFKSKEATSFKQKLQIYNRSKDHAEQLYCRKDTVTGSHRKKMRCVTEATRQLEEDAARLFFDRMKRGTN